jgi:hypothetical protein
MDGPKGYRQYPVYGPWTGTEPKQTVAGTVITYEQALWFLFIPIEAGYILKNRFGFFLSGIINPSVWSKTIDTPFCE